MPWFSGNGSSGPATVQSDGVTLQGDGSAGNKLAIKAVQLNASLFGAGTVASPLAITPARAFGPLASNQSGGGPSAANKIFLSMILIPCPLTFSKLSFSLSTGDAVNNCDYGFYNTAGTLIANIGAQIIASTSLVSYSTVQGLQTIPQGNYYFGFTSNATTAKINYNNLVFSAYSNTGFGTSVGGALPATITPPADSFGFAVIAPLLS